MASELKGVTPGKWSVSPLKQEVVICGESVDCLEIESDGDCCWLAQVMVHHNCAQTPEGPANALLFAQAKRMYVDLAEALKWLNLDQSISRGSDDMITEARQNTVDRITTTLAAARGEEQANG